MESTTAELAALFSLGEADAYFTVSGSGDPMELAQFGQVVLTGGGANYTVESTLDSVVSLLNSTPAVTERLTASGSGTTVLQALPSTPLSGGVARASVVTAAALVALFQSVSSVAEAMTAAVMGDPTALVQPAELFLSGGQAPASVSTVNEVVGLLNGTPEVAELIETTGSGETVVTAGTVSLSGGGEQVNPNGTRTYGWDVHGRLAQVSLPNGQVHSYSYDYRTRRIGLQQTAVGAEPAKSTAVVFSGGLSLAEYESQATQTTIASPSQSTVRYVRGPDMGGGVGGLLYSRRAQAVKFNLSNGRGDIVAQSDTSGALTWTASYEAYGKRTKETGENLDKQRGNSKDEDPTGLLNEGFRYRDLETGVWLSRDPAGFVDGPNLYAYVKQNPWTAFDPDGLKLKVPQSQRKQVDKYISDNGVKGHTTKSGGAPSGGFLGFGKSDPIDTIEGSASGTGLKAEIIASMISSDREFSFNDLKGLDSHVNARQANVEYLLKIAANSVSASNDPRYSFGPGRYPPNWKYTLENGGWGPAPGTTISQALDSLSRFKYPQFDCSRPIQYGRQWGEIMAGSGNPSATTSLQDGTQSFTSNVGDVIPGDHVQVRNNNADAPNHWRYENAVYLGKSGSGTPMYYANGMNPNPTTMSEILRETTNAGSARTPASIEHLRTHVGVGLAR